MALLTDPGSILSPCINVCELDKGNGLCRGCLRTLDEIIAWANASAAERLGILENISQRRRGVAA